MKKRFNAIKELAARGYREAGIALVVAVPALGMAQTTDPFDTALDEAKTKIEAYAGALIGVAAVAVVFMIGVKYVKKIRGAA